MHGLYFFEIFFFISNEKANYENLNFVFRFSFWNVSHQSLFWEASSKIELNYFNIGLYYLKGLLSWLKVKVNIISMYKIEFYFLSAIATESLLYWNKWNSEGKLPKRKRIFGAYYQKLLQRKWFAFKIFSKPCQWTGYSSCKRGIIFYYYY